MQLAKRGHKARHLHHVVSIPAFKEKVVLEGPDTRTGRPRYHRTRVLRDADSHGDRWADTSDWEWLPWLDCPLAEQWSA